MEGGSKDKIGQALGRDGASRVTSGRGDDGAGRQGGGALEGMMIGSLSWWPRAGRFGGRGLAARACSQNRGPALEGDY